MRLVGRWWLCLLAAPFLAFPQVIEFESNGLKYQTLTKNGLTIMYAHLPAHVHDYTVLQVAVANGSKGPYTIRPEDFTFVRTEGVPLPGRPAQQVVGVLRDKGSRNDVMRLAAAYETALYGLAHMRSNNGYESRRQAALGMASSPRLKAAAAASAIALVQTKLKPGDSTDGAVFFSGAGRHLGPGRLVVRTTTDVFEFNPE
jgi:hypothetical protein